MDTTKIAYFKEKLTKELALLEEELSTVGRRNPSNPDDWEATAPQDNVSTADRNEVADEIEDYETNTAILKDLEIRYNEVKSALMRIDEGAYGYCEITKTPIEIERLEANPAARTCKAHLHTKI